MKQSNAMIERRLLMTQMETGLWQLRARVINKTEEREEVQEAGADAEKDLMWCKNCSLAVFDKRITCKRLQVLSLSLMENVSIKMEALSSEFGAARKDVPSSWDLYLDSGKKIHASSCVTLLHTWFTSTDLGQWTMFIFFIIPLWEFGIKF